MNQVKLSRFVMTQMTSDLKFRSFMFIGKVFGAYFSCKIFLATSKQPNGEPLPARPKGQVCLATYGA
jgi:hypothetical protein